MLNSCFARLGKARRNRLIWHGFVGVTSQERCQRNRHARPAIVNFSVDEELEAEIVVTNTLAIVGKWAQERCAENLARHIPVYLNSGYLLENSVGHEWLIRAYL